MALFGEKRSKNIITSQTEVRTEKDFEESDCKIHNIKLTLIGMSYGCIRCETESAKNFGTRQTYTSGENK